MSASFNTSIDPHGFFNATTPRENNSAVLFTTPNDVKTGLAVRLRISLIGAIGNSVLLYACYQQQQPRLSASGILIMELTAYWLVQCAIYYPMLTVSRILVAVGYNVSLEFCTVSLSILTFLVLFGTVLEAAVAWNRLVAVWMPTRYRVLCSYKMTAIMSLVAVAVGSLYATSIGTGFGLTIVSVGDTTTCVFAPRNAWGAQLVVVSVFGPVVFPGICYGLLFFKVMQLRRRATTEAIGQAMQRRIRVSVALLGAFVCSLFCMLPTVIILVNFPHLLRIKSVDFWITTLYHSMSSFCPFVMLWMNGEYWTIVKGIVVRQFPKITPYITGTPAIRVDPSRIYRLRRNGALRFFFVMILTGHIEVST